MSHATSGMPARPVALDWRHGAIGPLAPCVLCGLPALCRSPVKNLPCHKACAETWIADHAADAADLARLIRACTPGGGAGAVTELRVLFHAHVCPDCGSDDITEAEVDTGDGITEIALTCRICGTAWPVACVVDWDTRP